MKFEGVKYIYFLGIGGIGMSALARYFASFQKEIWGYDRSSSELTRQLEAEGCKIHYHADLKLLSDLGKQFNAENALVIHTPAVPTDFEEYLFFIQAGFKIYKRSQVLGLISKGTPTLAVAGTHGKTTTSTLLTHLFTTARRDAASFMGGVALNFETNFIGGKSYIIVEADEYDRSFLTLYPQAAIITSLDPDHLDIYGTQTEMQDAYFQFVRQVDKDGPLLVHQSIADKVREVRKCFTYGLNPTADFYASNIVISNGQYSFDLVTPKETLKGIRFGFPGRHNLENAVGASALAVLYGIGQDAIQDALQSFKGVKRRFEYHFKSKSVVYIDDYAHHPTEIEAAIKAVRELYPNLKISGFFQPHLFTRTRDFANLFASSLDLLDQCYLLEIYPARELPIPGIDAEYLAKLMTKSNVKVITKSEVPKLVQDHPEGVWLTLGAGDIDQIVPVITHTLQQIQHSKV